MHEKNLHIKPTANVLQASIAYSSDIFLITGQCNTWRHFTQTNMLDENCHEMKIKRCWYLRYTMWDVVYLNNIKSLLFEFIIALKGIWDSSTATCKKGEQCSHLGICVLVLSVVRLRQRLVETRPHIEMKPHRKHQ